MASNVDIVEVLSELCSRREEWAWLTADYARRLSSGNTALFLEFPFAARPSHRIESAQLNAITILATLFVTPSVRAQFVSESRSVRNAYPRASDLDSTRKQAYCKADFSNTEMRGTVVTAQFGGESTSSPISSCCAERLRGEFRTSPR